MRCKIEINNYVYSNITKIVIMKQKVNHYSLELPLMILDVISPTSKEIMKNI
jgi:hypothetical protein